MAAGDLTTLANAMAWIGLAADDETDTTSRLITALSTTIQKFLGYQVLSATYTKTFNGRGGCRLMLPDRPVTAVASLTVDTISVPLSTSAVTPGFVFDDTTIYLRGYEFCRGVQNVQVVYTAGFPKVPGDIEQACLDWVKLTHDNLDTLPGISKLKAGDSEIDYGETFARIGKTTLMMPPVVAAALQPYRRMAPV